MNLLHVCPAYYPATYWGGPSFSVYQLNNALAHLPDMNLRVLTTDSAGPNVSDRVERVRLDATVYPGYEVFFTRRVAGASVSVGLLRRLPSLVRWADVVHLTATYSFPTLPTLALCRLLDKPVVWSPRGAILDAHEWEGAPRKRAKRAWEVLCNALIRPGRAVSHATSERELTASRIRIPAAEAIVIPNGVDAPELLPKRDWFEKKLRVMYLGRISPKKGIENLLRALHALKDPDVSLTIYGAGPDDYVSKLRQFAAALAFPDGVVSFAGHVSGEAKDRAFYSADLCVVPSFSENFCLVVAEALAHGVPVIASRGTPWSEVEDRRCGLWVDNSPESLTRAIVAIRAMPLADMGLRGWRWMRESFSWDTIASKMMGVYQSLLR